MPPNNSIQVVLAADTKGFSSSFSKATAGIRSFHKEIDNSMKAARALDRGLTSMAGKFTAIFGGLSGTLLAKSIWEAGTATESLRRSFEFITGSGQAAREELDFVRRTADELGLQFESTVGAYRNLAAAAKGTAIEGKVAREIFLGISEAATVLGLSAGETEGALLAISQMISKGKVSAEELRGQLGERLPGAFQIAAKAMGVTTAELDKMLSTGQLMTEDFLPKFAQALRGQFSTEAKKASESATAAFNRLSNSWLDLRSNIADSGFLDMATGKINDLSAALNDPQIRKRVIELSTRFFELAEAVLSFTVNHGEAIAKTLGAMVALSALSRTIHLITGVWSGLNAVMVSMTGVTLVSWFQQVRTAALAAAAGNAVMAASLKALGAAGLTFWAGSKVIEAVQAYREMREAQQMAAESAKNAEAAEARYQDRLARASAAAGVVLTSWREVQQAYKDGLIDYDQATDTYTKGAGKRRESYQQVTAAARESASEQKKVTGQALEDMKRQYEKFVSEINRLQEQIAGRQRSLAEELRAMGRTGMSGIAAWQDLKKEAREYEQAAQQAAASGDFEKAVELADQAKEKYKQLNAEVKDGDKILVSQSQALETAMEGVRRSGELAINALQDQKKAAEEAAKKLDLDAGGQLTESVKKVADGVGTITDSAIDMGDTMVDQINRFGVEAAKEFDDIERWLNSPHKMTIEMERVEKRAAGGPIGYAFGGSLPGYGGGDRISALLEAGEFVVRKEAVKKYGSNLFHALNSMSFDGAKHIMAKMGGFMNSLPQVPMRFNSGGQVPAAGAAGGNTYKLTVNFTGSIGNSGPALRSQAEQLFREFQLMANSSS